jgi:cell wall-associated NlpC family hydrolase
MLKYEHLLGIPFVHGSDDCYGIVRRFYADNFGIELTDYARPDMWWLSDMNLYMKYFRDEGFEVVNEPPHLARPADVFLLAIQSQDANHAGIYLGNGEILHHYRGRLSEVVKMKTMWRNPCAIVRHKDVVLPRETGTVDIIDHILPHKREALLRARSAS